MNKETTHIKCPNCGSNINVNEILYHQLQEDIKKQYAAKLADQQKQFDEKYSEIKKEKEALQKMKSEIGDEIEKGINKKLSFEKTKSIFNSDGNNYTNEEIRQMQMVLTNYARIYYDWYMRENEKGTWKDVISKLEERKDVKLIKELYTE